MVGNRDLAGVGKSEGRDEGDKVGPADGTSVVGILDGLRDGSLVGM